MAHSGNSFALTYRDKIVGHTMETDKASINYQKGNNFSAALLPQASFCEARSKVQCFVGQPIVVGLNRGARKSNMN